MVFFLFTCRSPVMLPPNCATSNGLDIERQAFPILPTTQVLLSICLPLHCFSSSMSVYTAMVLAVKPTDVVKTQSQPPYFGRPSSAQIRLRAYEGKSQTFLITSRSPEAIHELFLASLPVIRVDFSSSRHPCSDRHLPQHAVHLDHGCRSFMESCSYCCGARLLPLH